MTPPYFTPPPITLVRWPARAANQILERFVYGERYSGHRAPRGIDPAYVSWWIRERIKPDSSALEMSKVRDLLRFYERADMLDHLARMLTKVETNDRSWQRSCYILQCIGELGTVEAARFAAGYFHEFLLPLPFAVSLFGVTLETAESLAGSVDMGLIGRRLQRDIEIAGKVSDLRGEEGRQYRTLSDLSRNDLPNTTFIVEGKVRLLNTDPAQRLQELLVVYLGESGLSSPSMEIWSGRLVRAYARSNEESLHAVWKAFRTVMNAAQRSQMPEPKKNFLVHRSAQALLYLGGTLNFAEGEAYEKIETGPSSFLWDDPGMAGA